MLLFRRAGRDGISTNFWGVIWFVDAYNAQSNSIAMMKATRFKNRSLEKTLNIARTASPKNSNAKIAADSKTNSQWLSMMGSIVIVINFMPQDYPSKEACGAKTNIYEILIQSILLYYFCIIFYLIHSYPMFN